MPRKAHRLLPLALVLAAGALNASPALASHTQQSIIQDDAQLKADPVGTLATFRNLGADRIRVNVAWDAIATNRKPANASNPADYPAANWAPYDAIVRDAKAAGIAVDFTVGGPAPRWALGPHPASGTAGWWKPSPTYYGQFVRAVGTRYGGSYRPGGSSTALPAVRNWSIWNEPNYFNGLSPQTNRNGSQVFSAGEYRGLLAAAWGSLARTGHTNRRDTILIGELAPRGSNGAPGIPADGESEPDGAAGADDRTGRPHRPDAVFRRR